MAERSHAYFAPAQIPRLCGVTNRTYLASCPQQVLEHVLQDHSLVVLLVTRTVDKHDVSMPGSLKKRGEDVSRILADTARPAQPRIGA